MASMGARGAAFDFAEFKAMSTQNWIPGPRPEWLLEVNRVGRRQESVVGKMVSFDLDSLHEEASRNRGGLRDFGDEDYLEALKRLLTAIEKEAMLHLGGALVTHDEIVNALECRLWVEDVYRRHPEVEREELERPIFIIGLGRSGTSIVHETLAASPDLRAPVTWELRAPWIYELPGGEREQAKDAAWRAVRHSWFGVGPDLEIRHQMGRDMAQECAWALNQSFATSYFASSFLGSVPEFERWWTTADQMPSYRQYRRFLKALRWVSGDSSRTWVMKTPQHTFFTEVILKVFPDARLIWVHRDPIKTAASGINFQAAIGWSRCDQVVDTAKAGRASLLGAAAMLDRAIEMDEAMPKSRLSSVVYHEFLDSPVRTLARVREQLELGADEGVLRAMQDYLDARPQHAKGVHEYTLESIGVTDLAEARKPFEAYQRHFGVKSEW